MLVAAYTDGTEGWVELDVDGGHATVRLADLQWAETAAQQQLERARVKP